MNIAWKALSVSYQFLDCPFLGAETVFSCCNVQHYGIGGKQEAECRVQIREWQLTTDEMYVGGGAEPWLCGSDV